MLAIETGWTPDVIAELPTRFHQRCRWLLYARAICGPEGLPTVEIPRQGSADARLAAMKAKAAIAPIRSLLFPDD